MDVEAYFRFILALVFVLALIGVIALVARRLGFGYAAPKRGKGRRLSVIEVATVDARRRLALLRRDDTEHLVLLGAGSELLIESGIRPPASGSFAAALDASSPGAVADGEDRS